MNKSILMGVLIGATVVTAGGVGALALKQGGSEVVSGPLFAEVTQVKPVIETVRTPREECHDEVVTYQKQATDEHQIAGTAIGAILGGAIGNQVGGGNGKKLATVAGAVAGGYAGKKVQGNMQAQNTYQETEQRCETKYDVSQRTLGYDVSYHFEDKDYTVRMAEKPTQQRLQVNSEGDLIDALESQPKG